MPAIEIEGSTKTYGHIRALSNVSSRIDTRRGDRPARPQRRGQDDAHEDPDEYLEPDDGKLAVHGIDVVADPIAAQRRIGYLPESAPLYGEMLVQEFSR